MSKYAPYYCNGEFVGYKPYSSSAEVYSISYFSRRLSLMEALKPIPTITVVPGGQVKIIKGIV